MFRRYGEAYRQEHGASLSIAQRRVMTAIEVCRTAVLGGHLEQWSDLTVKVTLLSHYLGDTPGFDLAWVRQRRGNRL